MALDTDIIDDLQQHGVLRRYAEGDVILSEGDPADSACVLRSGQVDVVIEGEVRATLEAGQIFGELGVLGSGVRTATVLSVGECEVVFVDKNSLRSLMTTMPSLSNLLFRLIAERARSISTREQTLVRETSALADMQRRELQDLRDATRGYAIEADLSWEPLVYASGDWCEALQRPDERLVLAFGDVMSHGPRTGPMLGAAQAELRELLRRDMAIADVLKELDLYLARNRRDVDYLTLLLIEVGGTEGCIELVSGGHFSPWRVRNGEVRELEITAGSPPGLGYTKEAPPEPIVLAIEAGDVLLMCSDGFAEARHKDGGIVGRPYIRDLVSELVQTNCDNLATRLRHTMEKVNGLHFDDDATAMSLRFPSPPRATI